MIKNVLRTYLILSLGAILFLFHPASTFAEENFTSPEEAMEKLAEAVESHDTAHIISILGKGSEDIVYSGDPIADKNARQRFLQAYKEKHSTATEGSKALIILGAQEWPFPIPLVKDSEGWHFDLAQGRDEILARRIGKNEMDAAEVCFAYVDAQHDYADMSLARTGIPAYAQRVISTPGKKDGLYWPTKKSEPESPIGVLVAAASAEGYKIGGERQPFHGYYYKILTRQGASAQGGAYDYIADGKMIGGFALVAWPAEYGNSGITTFLINHDGILYQKDLGPETAKIAQQMDAFNPDSTWQKMDEPSEEKN